MSLPLTFEDIVTPAYVVWMKKYQRKRFLPVRPFADQCSRKQDTPASVQKPYNKLTKRIITLSTPSNCKETKKESKPPIWEINLSLLSPAVDFDPTFTTEYFEVKASTKGGLGAFAVKNIKKGTVIMLEAPLFKGNVNTAVSAYQGFTAEQAAEYLSLHAWTGSSAGSSTGCSTGYRQRITCIFATNRFLTTQQSDGIFLRSSRFNHACHPYSTCTYEYKPEVDKLKTTALMDIPKGQEITISYSSRPEGLYENYGFHCDCPGCPPCQRRDSEIALFTNDDPFYF